VECLGRTPGEEKVKEEAEMESINSTATEFAKSRKKGKSKMSYTFQIPIVASGRRARGMSLLFEGKR